MVARGRRPGRYDPLNRGAVPRRIAVTVVAGVVVIAAEIAATLSPAPVRHLRRQRPIAGLRAMPSAPDPGEPELPPASNVRQRHDQRR